MGKMKRYQMDLEEQEAFEPIVPTTKKVAVSVTTTYYYEVSWDFNIDNDDGLTSLLANGTPIDEQISGDSQLVRDCAIQKERLFTFEG